MTRAFAIVALAMTLASNGWADEDKPYVEPKLYTSAPYYGPGRPCPHYAGGCRDHVRSWLAHLDAEVEEPMRVALYNYGYRSARKESIAAHRAAATDTTKVLLGDDERALTKEELVQVAKAGISAFLDAAAEHKAKAAEEAEEAM
jgi:hypothetical protein